jgi:hypothetical protein
MEIKSTAGEGSHGCDAGAKKTTKNHKKEPDGNY